jgi:hypothetical protein
MGISNGKNFIANEIILFFDFIYSLDLYQGNLDDNLDNVCKQSQAKIQ